MVTPSQHVLTCGKDKVAWSRSMKKTLNKDLIEKIQKKGQSRTRLVKTLTVMTNDNGNDNGNMKNINYRSEAK